MNSAGLAAAATATTPQMSASTRRKPSGMFTFGAKTSNASAEEDDEDRKRILEILFATPMRQFSPTLGRVGGGTLRVRVVHVHSPRFRLNTNVAAQLFSKLLSSSPSSSPRKPSATAAAAGGRRREYALELTLGSAKGKTGAKAAGDGRKGEVDFPEQWIRLFVPDEDDAMLLQVVREAVREDHHSALQQRRVLYLKVVDATSGTAMDLESALDLDNLLLELSTTRMFTLPLISRLEPHEPGLGQVQIQVSFERHPPVSTSPLLSSLTRTSSTHLLHQLFPRTGEEEGGGGFGERHSDLSTSAVALLASAVRTLTLPDVGLPRSSSLALPQPPSPSAKLVVIEKVEIKRRLSCPASLGRSREQENDDEEDDNDDGHLCHNQLQLAGLREGWRMWRLVDKSQYQPSHRAQDAAMVGERFLNREAASSFFEPAPAMAITLPAAWLKTIANTITPPSVTATPALLAHMSWCQNKTVLITGGTSGVGREIVRELCKRQVKRLILLCRNLHTGREQAREWTHMYRNIEIDVIQCNLASMLETDRALGQVRTMLQDEDDVLDCVVLCAATISQASPPDRDNSGDNETVDGDEVEESFAVNYLANYLIVHSLLGSISQIEGRIILAGCSNSFVKDHVFDMDNLRHHPQQQQQINGSIGLGQYMRTKSMLGCFASELAIKLEASFPHISCTIFYPGAVKTKLADKVLYQVNPTLAKLADAAYGMMEGILIRTPKQGAALAVFLCSAHRAHVVNGKVYRSGFTGDVTNFAPHEVFGVAADREKCAKLWVSSGRLLNQLLGKDSKMTEWWGLFRPQRPA
ncbi:hypothetical protein BASA81_006213 [Batrachochytrium salamandrivorans]|nr:hypothetical protein BASA81_006213 [Batrachochytrium salamandrivorans]